MTKFDQKLDQTRDKVSGKAKELEGQATNDKLREHQGQAQQALGKAKAKLAEAKDQVEDAVQNGRKRLNKAAEDHTDD